MREEVWKKEENAQYKENEKVSIVIMLLVTISRKMKLLRKNKFSRFFCNFSCNEQTCMHTCMHYCIQTAMPF